MLMAVPHSAHSSSILVSMEDVEYEPEYDPAALTKYYSCGVQIGRSNNPEIKDMILKAKKHLSAIGYTFFYVWKNSGRRELRYRSPTGKKFVSLRTACEAAIGSQIGSQIGSKIGSQISSQISSQIVSQDCHYDHDLDEGSSTTQEVTEQEKRLVKNDESLSNSRPQKRIRIADVESQFLRQQMEDSVGKYSNDLGTVNDEKKDGLLMNRPTKSLRKIKELLESGKKINKFKKPIRKVKPPSSGRKGLLSQLIQMNIVSMGSRVTYRSKKDNSVMAVGRIFEEGIQCDCCNEFFLQSKFEAHAGSTYRRPAARIFLDDGRSLLDCQTQLNLENELHTITKCKESCEPELFYRLKGQDEYCSFCNDGGELLLCDSCTSSYHSSCIGLDGVPDSEYWFCPSCCCGICLEGQITEDSHSRITCEQCEHRFHVDCLQKEGIFVPFNDDKTFCSEKCKRIFSGLTGILGVSIPLTEDNLSWSLLKMVRDDDKNINEENTKTYRKLNVALNVMHECFEPVPHAWSDNDVVEDVIFSRAAKKSNFKGFFTAVLEIGEEVVTAVTFRVHGCKVAEIPFIATRFQYQRLGMCRILMEEVERKLGELGVERLVMPAVPEMVGTWMQSFGFEMMTGYDRLRLLDCKFLDFPGTIKCQKILKKI